jgi:excisionase family DNA binding protein
MPPTTHTHDETDHTVSTATTSYARGELGLEPWVSKRQLSEYLGVSTRWVNRRVVEGMPMLRFGSQPRFKISAVEAWVAQGAEH